MIEGSFESLSSENVDGPKPTEVVAAPEAKTEPIAEETPAEVEESAEEPSAEIEDEAQEEVETGEAPTPEIEEVELSSLFDGKYSTTEELITAHTSLTEEKAALASANESLKQQLAVKQGVTLTASTMSFENLAKEVGEDAAPLLYGSVIKFEHDNNDKLKATVLKQIKDDPSLVGLEAQLMEELREEFEDGSELKQRRMESQADKDAAEIMALKEKISVNSVEERNKVYEATRSKVEGLASEALSNLSVKVPGVENLDLDVSKDAIKYESAFINYVASTAAESGGLTPEVIEQGKQLVQNQIILEKFHDGTLLGAMQKKADLKAQKKVILKKSNPTTVENPRVAKVVKQDDDTARVAAQLGWG